MFNMYFFTVIAFAVLPFIVGAVPVSQKSSRTRDSISIPLTKRITFLNEDGTVHVDKAQAGEHHVVARLEQALTAYKRNTGRTHPLALKREHERRNFTSTNFVIQNAAQSNVMFVGNISAGTPPRPYSMQFTTQADTFFFDPTCQTCKGHNFYDITISSTANSLGTTATLDINGHPVSGNVATDTLSIFGFEATNQAFLLATTVDPAFQSSNFSADGMMGFGFKTASALGKLTFFDTLINDNNGLPSHSIPFFSMYLEKSAPQFIIGSADTSKYSGTMVFVNLVIDGIWQIPLDKISISGKDVQVSQDAIIDPSSAFMSGDAQTVSSIYGNFPNSSPIPNSNLWTMPCDTPVSGMTITLGNNTFSITPNTFNIGPVPGTNVTQDMCIGGLAVAPDQTSWVLGAAFMENMYILFDEPNARVGLAQAAAPTLVSS